MRIAVNTRLLLHNKLEGIGWFTFETLKRIVQQHPEHQFFFLFDRPYHESFIFAENVTPVVIAPPARHAILFYIWFEWSVTKTLKKYNIDLFLSPDGYLSLTTKVPSIAVMHDLNFEHYPKDLGWWNRKYYSYFFPKFAKKATRIATVSEYSKSDIVKTYGVKKSKIDVVFNGANPIYQPITSDLKQTIKEKWSDGKPYLLYVGALHKRKNITRLLKAFDLVAKSHNELNLLIVGKKMFADNEMEQAFADMQYKNRVVFTDRLPVSDLHHVLASALGLVYIPYFEGFGIPVIEAMQCGTPVITANCTSLPEIAGNAALLVDPFEVKDIASKMNTLIEDNILQQKLSIDGLKNAQRFSWDKTANALWNVIKQVIND